MKSLIGNRTTKTRPGKKKAKYKSYQIKGSTNAKTYGETILMYSRITKKVRQCWNPVKEERGRVEVRSWRLCRFLCHARLSFCFSLQLAAIIGLIWIVLFKKKKKKTLAAVLWTAFESTSSIFIDYNLKQKCITSLREAIGQLFSLFSIYFCF